MGKQRGLSGVIGCALLMSTAACGRDTAAVQQRELLRGRDRSAEILAAEEKRRILSAEGELLPSELKVAGIVIPRGFTPALQLERQWYFESKLPRDKAEQYFTQRLAAKRVARNELQELEFNEAREKSDATMKPAFVRIGVTPGADALTRIHVIEMQSQAPVQATMTDDQVNQRLSAARTSAR